MDVSIELFGVATEVGWHGVNHACLVITKFGKHGMGGAQSPSGYPVELVNFPSPSTEFIHIK